MVPYKNQNETKSYYTQTYTLDTNGNKIDIYDKKKKKLVEIKRIKNIFGQWLGNELKKNQIKKHVIGKCVMNYNSVIEHGIINGKKRGLCYPLTLIQIILFIKFLKISEDYGERFDYLKTT